MWRQLWRVIERSDIILHILDARDPLAFRSIDLEDYVANHHILYRECYENLLKKQEELRYQNQQAKQRIMTLTPSSKSHEIIEEVDIKIERSESKNHSAKTNGNETLHSPKREQSLSMTPKKTVLLLNKADFLTPKQRKYWAEYFKKEGVPFVFFSAYREQQKLDILHKIQREKQRMLNIPSIQEDLSIDFFIDQLQRDEGRDDIFSFL